MLWLHTSSGLPAERHAAVLDVRSALARLPPRFREPILLATYEELTYPEIAEVIGCPIGPNTAFLE